MKDILLLIIFSSLSFFIFSDDQTDDDYTWIKNEKLRMNIEKIDKFRKKNKSKAFYSGSINLVLFYYFDVWQGVENDHNGNYGYSTRNFQYNKYHSMDNKGIIEKNPWGGIETGFYGNFCISAPLFESKKPLLSENRISFEFNWDFNWMQAGCGIKFTFSPIPIYYTSTNINIGTGWEWLWSDGSPLLIGMGLCTRDGSLSIPLLGPVINANFTNGLQMDFSALPIINKKIKRWTHIILTASVNIGYQGLINIDQNQPYIYMNNKNLLSGWQFSFVTEFGYIIPVIEDKTNMDSFRKFAHRRFSIFPLLQTVVSFDITHFSDSKMNEGGWGSDFVKISLKPLLIFSLPFNFKIIFYSRFINNKRFSMSSIGNVYYQDREYEDWFFMFENIGIIFGWDF